MDEKSEEHKEEEVKRSDKLNHIEGIFALGDCCANIGSPLPALAQVTSFACYRDLFNFLLRGMNSLLIRQPILRCSLLLSLVPLQCLQLCGR